MTNEESHVDGTVERVKQQVEVGVAAQFTAADGAAESGVGLPPPWQEETLAEGCNQVGIALARSQNRGDDAAARAAEDLHHLAHLLAHVGVDGTSVGKTQPASGAAGKGVRDQRALVWPPAVYSGFADSGALRDSFNREVRETVLLQNFQGTAQDRLPRLLAARAARRSLPAAIFAGSRGH